MTDPWERRVPKMNPEEYLRYLVDKFAADAEAAAVRIHMQNRGVFLEKADACRAWLRNGTTALTDRQIDFVLEAVAIPDPNSPVDPLETDNDRMHRATYIRGVRAALVAAKGR